MALFALSIHNWLNFNYVGLFYTDVVMSPAPENQNLVRIDLDSSLISVKEFEFVGDLGVDCFQLHIWPLLTVVLSELTIVEFLHYLTNGSCRPAKLS